MDQLQNILAVAGGERALSIALEPVSVLLLFAAVFAAMLLAILTAKLIWP